MDVTFPKFIPNSTVVTVSWMDKVALDKPVTKGKVIGLASFVGFASNVEIKAPVSGLVASMITEPLAVDQDTEQGKLVLMKIDSCQHPLVYDQICTICFEPNIKKHTQKIFDKISSISASDEIVKDKITEITRGHKMILILDLDNTIIHARQVPLEYEYRGKFPDELESDFFEVCPSGTTKFIVKKRPMLDAFLQKLDQSFAIFVYTFGTRIYGLEVIHNIDPEEKILKKSRLISKSDYKNLNHKELEKIIPEKYRDLVLILDDNKEVWSKYKDNLVQVYPYYFWQREEDNEVIRSVDHSDHYLHYLGHFLQRSVDIYKKYKTEHSPKTLKLYRVVRVLHNRLFQDLCVHFTCVVSVTNPEEVLKLRETIILKQRHGKVSLNYEESNLIIANTFKCTKKIKQAQLDGKPAVHFSWIRYSVVNLIPMSTEFFAVSNISEEKVKNLRQFDKDMMEFHTMDVLDKLAAHVDLTAYKHLCHEDLTPSKKMSNGEKIDEEAIEDSEKEQDEESHVITSKDVDDVK